MPCLPEPSVAERDIWRGAPALFQQARRLHMEPCSGRRARRALFGPADREETRRFVKEELAAIRTADQLKYNFDFDSMTPLPGESYEWEVPKPGEVPQAYELARLQSGLFRSARRLDFDAPRPEEGSEASRDAREATPELEPSRPESAPSEPARPASPAGLPATSAEPSQEPAPAESAASSAPRPACARQTAITDFWRSRKRPSAFAACCDTAAKRSLASSEPTRPSSAATKPGSPA